MTAELIRDLQNLKYQSKGCVLTIGNFDGVHKGHQALLARTREVGISLKIPSMVMTFEPLPKEFFFPEKPVPRITRFREKFLDLSLCKINKILNVRFKEKFANLSANEFIDEILIKKLNVKHIVLGGDFHFGKGRDGDRELLKNAGKKHGFTVETMPSIIVDNRRVSSTWIREALGNADLELVYKLLGHPYTMQGRIVHGDKRGRLIGFPTANIYLLRTTTPIKGVYAVRVHGIENKVFNGVANVGVRPTVGGTRTLLEVHLFDFDKEIYGLHVKIEFCKKLRDEQRFDSFDLLKQQILKDAETARNYFKVRI